MLFSVADLKAQHVHLVLLQSELSIVCITSLHADVC